MGRRQQFSSNSLYKLDENQLKHLKTVSENPVSARTCLKMNISW